MLQGCVPWPDDFARLYRERGYWSDITIGEQLDQSIARWSEREALVYGAERVSYRELGARIDRLAIQLVESGLKPLDRVVLQLPNIPEFIYVYYALVKIGVIPVMAMRAHRHTEISHCLSSAGAVGWFIPGLFGNFDFPAMAEELQPSCPTLRQVFVAGTPRAGQHALGPMIAKPANKDVRASLTGLRPAPSEVALMLLSGGTTALPKLIPRTHNDYVYNCTQSGRAAGFNEHTVYLAVLPLSHNYNLACPGIMAAFAHGGKVVLAESPNAETVLPLVERERVTVIAAAVPLVVNWLNSPVPKRHDISSLKVIQNGGARLAPELRQRVRDELGVLPQEIYGTAEGLINIVRIGEDDEEQLLHSSGTPISPGDEIKVVDDVGNEVPDGEPGELLTRGPYTIRGYYNAPEKNKEAFTADGFYRMGDIVRKRGRNLYTEGRRKDLINRGGEKISCDEIENYIFAHPKVKSVTLVAMPDDVFGEKACAFVIPKPGENLTFDELITFLRAQKIASFKLPERLELRTEFPLSPAGKILKRTLREEITAQLATEKRARK
jgi:2,3-dihydroxybenzoate-AMP ligase